VAAAAELVKGKLGGVPGAVVRGLGHRVGSPAERAADLIRRPEDDLFRWGPREAVESALARVAGFVVIPVAQSTRVVLCVPAAQPPPELPTGLLPVEPGDPQPPDGLVAVGAVDLGAS
ncbi:MAG: hypothetical protein JO079_13975, partial [Frankiaceae bacterium]|nr:hypothetical protein [Frankiaceae bacterium]